MSPRLSTLVAAIGSLALAACASSELEVSELHEEELEYQELAAFAGAGNVLRVDQSTRLLSLDVLRILKHSAGHWPQTVESGTMERWTGKVHQDFHTQSLEEVKNYYEVTERDWYRIGLGWTEGRFDDLSQDRKSMVLSHYQDSVDFWVVMEPAMDELAFQLSKLEPLENDALPRNAPQLLYYAQYLAFRAFRAGIPNEAALNSSMYVDSLQRTLERKLRLNDLSRTGINVPRRPPIDL